MLLERIRECADDLGKAPSRREFLSWHRERYGSEEGVSTRQQRKAGGWTACLQLALTDPAEGAAEDWDDDTDRIPLHPLPEGHYLKGVSTLVGPSGEIKAQWVKTHKQREERAAILTALLDELPDRVDARSPQIPPPTGGADDLLAVYPMGDPHIGMLAWHEETGEDWDLRLAETTILRAFDALADQSPATRHAMLVSVGDLFHADNEQGVTSRHGHVLDVDSRYFKVARVGFRVVVHSILRLLEAHEHVRVVMEMGNHDDISSMWLSIALDAYFSDEPRVDVDLSPSRFHWHRWGKCLIGITHGHNQKHVDLESIMAAERAEDWGQTRHRYWYVGHIHHKRQMEMRGCVVESFRTLAPRDAWAANVGYRSGRDLNRILLHRDHGEVGRSTVSAEYLRGMHDRDQG